MKPYMAYDRNAGSAESAMLVFAPTGRIARRISFEIEWCTSEWIDWTATLIKDLPPHLQALNPDNRQCVITAPPVCKSCELWGGKIIGEGCSLCAGGEA